EVDPFVSHPCFPFCFDTRAYPLSCRSTRGKEPADSAAGALKFAHETSKSLNGFESHSVVERDAHAADGTVPGSAGEPCCRRFVSEFLFDGLVAAGNAEDDVHLRARTLLHRAVVEPSAVFDGVVKEFSFRVVTLLNARDSAERFNPFENQAD